MTTSAKDISVETPKVSTKVPTKVLTQTETSVSLSTPKVPVVSAQTETFTVDDSSSSSQTSSKKEIEPQLGGITSQSSSGHGSSHFSEYARTQDDTLYTTSATFSSSYE